MQAIILAAGESSRFYPFNGWHKSMVRILGKTILEHTLLSIKKSGIKNIIVVIGKNSKVEKIVENGKNLGLNIRYLVQAKPCGMGDALLCVEKYIKSDFFLLHAHHLDFFKFKKILESKKRSGSGIILLTRKITDSTSLGKSGVLKVKGEKALEVVEKPKSGEEPSNLGIIGIYLLNKSFLKTLKTVPSQHYSFEKAISLFAKKNQVGFTTVDDGNDVSLKYPWEILRFKDEMFKSLKRYIDKSAQIAKSAQIIGDVCIDEGAKIMEQAVIKGPCYIGKNAFVGNGAVLRDGVDLEENTVVGANIELKNSLLMENSKVHSGFIGDSIIGENSRIGAQFCTANVRLDRKTIKVVVKGEKVDSGLKSLGVIIGHNAYIGIKSSTMPGVVIGNNAMIGPSTTVVSNVSDNSKYYTKFQETVIKK